MLFYPLLTIGEALVKHSPYPGQTLKITNPDTHIISEEWAELAVEPPVITFSCKSGSFCVPTSNPLDLDPLSKSNT